MRSRRFMWMLLALPIAACGRIGFGFEGAGGDDVATDAGPDAPLGQVTVSVSGGAGAPDQGLPIKNAYVVFESDAGSIVVQTDATGTATADVSGATTVHIAYPTADGGALGASWRVLSFYEIEVGSQLLIGAGDQGGWNAHDFALPATTTMGYQVRGPRRCLVKGTAPTATVTTSYARSCEGKTVPVLAFADSEWNDLGPVLLTSTGMSTVVTAWTANVGHDVRFDGLPVGKETFAGVRLAKLYGSADAVVVAQGEDSTTTGTLSLMLGGAALAPDRMLAFISDDGGKQSGRFAVAAAPAPVGGVRVVPASAMPRSVDDVAFDRPSRTSVWSYGASGTPGVVAIALFGFDTADGDHVEWTAYRPATATTHTIPVLPAPLGGLTPAASSEVLVVAGTTRVKDLPYPDLLARVDRELSAFYSSFDDVDLITNMTMAWRTIYYSPGPARATPPTTPTAPARERAMTRWPR